MELMNLETGVITSNKIAELTGKEHKNVMRDIKIIIEDIGVEEVSSDLSPSTYIDNVNRNKPNYTLSKDGLMLIITGYSAIHRMKLIKYTRELENKVAVPKTALELAREQVLLLENIETLQLKIETDKPRVSFAETIEKASDLILIRDLSKILGNEGIKMGQNKLYQWLREKKLIEKQYYAYTSCNK